MLRWTWLVFSIFIVACGVEFPEGVGDSLKGDDGAVSDAESSSSDGDTSGDGVFGDTSVGGSSSKTIDGEMTSVPPTKTALSLFLTDAPADYDAVWVTVGPVEAEIDDSWEVLMEGSERFDLLKLQNGALAALGETVLEPGVVGQIRMIVQDAEVVVDGKTHGLKIPSGTETGIKIPLDAEVVAGAGYELVLDFDALKSVKKVGLGYLMQPVIQVKDFEMVTMPGTGFGGAGGAMGYEEYEEEGEDIPEGTDHGAPEDVGEEYGAPDGAGEDYGAPEEAGEDYGAPGDMGAEKETAEETSDHGGFDGEDEEMADGGSPEEGDPDAGSEKGGGPDDIEMPLP